MASTVVQSWRIAQRIEKELSAKLREKIPVFNEINQKIGSYRTSCESLIFQDFVFAIEKDVETDLWKAHGRVNICFRKQLSYFRDGDGKRKPVEKRKTMKQYLDFIKSSQRFYRAFIQSLASRFGGIPELDAVAHKFNLDLLPTDDGSERSLEIAYNVLLFCHQALVHLGDLSRYRETELVTRDRNWGPAIGYYDLAGTIRPSSGASHNQLAVIALADLDHFRSTYHLYRALAVEEPHETAKGNLEIGFKKILSAWEKGELLSSGSQNGNQGPGKALKGWFLRLHARCHKGTEFSEHDELENEVLSQLVIDLKERSLEGTLHKIILSNIAAEYFAGIRLRDEPDSPENVQAYFFFKRLNTKTFFTLLQIFQPELESLVNEDDVTLSADHIFTGADSITAVTRRLLPGLRHYSSWLISNTPFLVTQTGDAPLSVQTKELWKTYASTLTLLAATFPILSLPGMDYLFEEDEDTLGFKPFETIEARRRYFIDDTDKRKLKLHDEGVERHHPNIEMVGRVRDFLRDGLELAVQDKEVPIDFVAATGHFIYREDGMPSELIASPENRYTTLSSTRIEREELSLANSIAVYQTASVVDGRTYQSASASISAGTTVNRMVDKLVDSEAASDSEYHDRAPPTPPSHTFGDDSPTKDDGNETNYSLFGTSTAQGILQEINSNSPVPQQQGISPPLLPSIYHSPFAPMPEEVTSLRPSTANPVSQLPLPQHVKNLNNVPLSTIRQQPEGVFIQSSISSMQDPSSILLPGSGDYPQSNHLAGNLENGMFNAGVGNPTVTGRPSTVYGNESAFDESMMFSPLVFKGIPWEGTGHMRQADFETPPNGQGG